MLSQSHVNQITPENDMETVKSILEKEEDLDSAVWSAAYKNDANLVYSLISSGANRNYAALGAGEGNRYELIDQLAEIDASTKDSAVEGAALRNHGQLVVQLLKRGASRNYAARGAAEGNHIDLLRELIVDDISRNYAVWGAALANNAPLVFTLIAEGANINDAVLGAAAGGHIDLVKELIKRGANPHLAVQGAAAGGHMELLNMLIKDQLSKEYALQGAIDGKHLENKEEKLLYYILSVNDLELQTFLIKKAQEINKVIDSKALPAKVSKLNELMETYKLNIKQAYVWLTKLELHILFLQGIEKVKDGTLPLEMFLYVASYVSSLSDHDTIDLFVKHYEGMPKKLLDTFLQHLENKFHPKSSFNPFSFFQHKNTDLTEIKYTHEKNLAYERYEYRKKL